MLFTTDTKRFFGLLLLFCAMDLLAALAFRHHEPSSFDRNSLAAALLTVLWAVRDGQKKDDTP